MTKVVGVIRDEDQPLGQRMGGDLGVHATDHAAPPAQGSGKPAVGVGGTLVPGERRLFLKGRVDQVVPLARIDRQEGLAIAQFGACETEMPTRRASMTGRIRLSRAGKRWLGKKLEMAVSTGKRGVITTSLRLGRGETAVRADPAVAAMAWA
jgi:hypothetical protein